MSLSYIEAQLKNALTSRLDKVLGCRARVNTNEPIVSLYAEGSDLVEYLLEMADKGNLTSNWHILKSGDMAWFWYAWKGDDVTLDYSSAIINFDPFPELEFLPNQNSENGYLQFGEGVKLSDILEAEIVKGALAPVVTPDPEMSEDFPALSEDEIPF
jgi:hypothetical protein